MDDDRTRLDDDRARRRALFRRRHIAVTAFLREILLTAEAIERARDLSGEPAMHLDPGSRMLRAIERCGGAPTFTDLGRLMGISRQAALTPSGRRVLEQRRMPQFAWPTRCSPP